MTFGTYSSVNDYRENKRTVLRNGWTLIEAAQHGRKLVYGEHDSGENTPAYYFDFDKRKIKFNNNKPKPPKFLSNAIVASILNGWHGNAPDWEMWIYYNIPLHKTANGKGWELYNVIGKPPIVAGSKREMRKIVKELYCT